MAVTSSCLMNMQIPLHGCGQDNVRFESFEHGKSLLEGLRHLRQMQQLFDVILVAEDKEFPAHRVVLASCSDYFRAMFTDGLKECSQSRIILSGLTASSISHLLDFAYNSTINIDSDNVVDVLSGATYVQILPVITACENYLRDHLSVDNCFNTAAIAELFSMHHLQQHSFSYICRNWSSISTDSDFCQLPAQFLINLLSSGYPVDCKECDVLMSVLRWFSVSPSERCRHVMSILNCIIIENICEEDLCLALSSAEWLESSKVLPDLLNYFSSLNFLSKCDISSKCMNEGDNIFSLKENIQGRKFVINKSEMKLKWQGRISPLSFHPQGLENLRGLHPTVVVAGGFRKETGMTNNLMYLDPGTGNLKYLSKIPHLDQINFGVTVFQNQIFVVGGCFNDHMQEIAHPFGFKFNPLTDKWDSIAPMLQERCRFLLCATPNKIYAIGGDPYASDVGLENVAQCEVYDPEIDDWKSISPLPGNRSQIAGTAFMNYVAISGGIQENEERVFNDFYLYNPCADSWEKKADMLSPRTDHSMMVWEDSVYVIGGWHLDPITKKRVMATSIDCYDFKTDSWEVVGALNSSRTLGTYTLANDNIYAVGGWSDGNHLQKCRTIDLFNLKSKSWVRGREQKVALWEHCACSLYLPKYAPTSSTS